MTTILVADDSSVDRKFIGGILGKEPGWKVLQAAHGREALDLMRNQAPDLVVTDLQMPELDGLELVAAIRADYPDVPVILMTAFGSEALAVEALEAGAASYVPKLQAADILPGTVKQVLALARANRSHERLIECLHHAQFHFTLDNDPALIDSLVDLVQQMCVGIGLCDSGGRLRIGVALEQALRNALYHGNLEITAEQMEEAREALLQGQSFTLLDQRRRVPPYAQRRLHVDVHLDSDEARFTIADDGPGMDTSRLPQRGDVFALQDGADRGFVLMTTFMDEVTFNAKGNEVTLIKRRVPAPTPALAEQPA